jgi:tRNA pseudouridine55 synthase
MTEYTGLAKDYLEGAVLLFDKPLGWTSFDIIKKVKALLRHQLRIKKIKIGHAGTLDPLASGLLIVCTGKMTKSIEKFQADEKEYTGTFFIGSTTPSADLETEPNEHFPTSHISQEEINARCTDFLGEIAQVPPLFSAKKIDGERAYEHARRGENTVLKANLIQIHNFAITQDRFPELDFRVVCSKGTYIRALARDYGEALKSGAYLKALRRTRIGEFWVDDAWDIQAFETFIKQEAGTKED